MPQLPNAIYVAVARKASSGAALPSGQYTAHAMATSGKTIVTPDVGAWIGRRDPQFTQIVAQSGSFTGWRDALHPARIVTNFASKSVTRSLIGDPSGSTLPAARYTAHAMATSGKTIVTPDTFNWIGARQFRFQQLFDAPNQSAAAMGIQRGGWRGKLRIIAPFISSAASQLFSSAGTYSFTVPAGITSITIECWGPGGAGGAAGYGTGDGVNYAWIPGGGGGGGAYAKKVLAVTPGHTYTVVVATGTNKTTFDTATVVADFGVVGGRGHYDVAQNGAFFLGTPGTGGLAANSAGDVVTSGSDAGATNNPLGGTGGTAANGGTGGSPGGIATHPPTGNDGARPGGGGGGAAGGVPWPGTSDNPGGAGADGQVLVSWGADGAGAGGSGQAAQFIRRRFPKSRTAWMPVIPAPVSSFLARVVRRAPKQPKRKRSKFAWIPILLPGMLRLAEVIHTAKRRTRAAIARSRVVLVPPRLPEILRLPEVLHVAKRRIRDRIARSRVASPPRTTVATVPDASLIARGLSFLKRAGRRNRSSLWWEWLAGYDFSIALAPASATAVPGAVLVYTVTIAPAASPSTVHLSVSGLPFGTLAVFGATSITGAGSTTLTLYLNEGALAQVASVAVTGTSGYFSHTTSTALTIEREQLGSIMILIDSLDRTDLLTYASGRIGWNLMRGNRGTCSLPFIVDPGSTFAPQIGQYVEIWDQAKRVWAGDADGVDIAWLGDDGHHVTTVSGVSLEARFDGVSLDKVQYGSTPTPITCGAAFAAIFTAAAVPGVTLGTIEAGPDLESLNVTNVKDAFDTLAKIAGKIWYIDPRDLKIYFHDAALRAADWELTDQASSALGGIVWESIAYRQNRTDFADTQVSQLPGAAIAPQSTSFAGDGATTLFTLPAAPQFILSADVSPEGSGAATPLGHTITWTPGTNQIACTPAMKTGESLIVKWLDSGQVSDATLAYGSVIGHRTRRYTRTRTFTAAGALQEATAALARYALLPAQLTLQTDKPGITIGRKWQVGISSPVEAAGLLNGYWQVIEVEAEIVEGMDQLAEPFGHWRYTLHLVNFSATAIFQGDGSTASFTVPGPAATIGSVTVKNAGGAYVPTILGNTATIAPAPPEGATVTIQYTNGINPDVQPFTDTLQQLAPVPGLPGEPGPSAGSSAGDGSVPSATSGLPQLFSRTLTLYDMTVRNDAAPNTYAVHAGVGKRVVAVLRKSITADATIRLNFFDGGPSTFLFTVPDTQPVDDPLVFPLVVGSPATALLIEDLEVFTADILESDGSGDDDGVLQVTVEWEYD